MKLIIVGIIALAAIAPGSAAAATSCQFSREEVGGEADLHVRASRISCEDALPIVEAVDQRKLPHRFTVVHGRWRCVSTPHLTTFLGHTFPGGYKVVCLRYSEWVEVRTLFGE